METTEKRTFTDQIIAGLNKAIVEIEEFRLQAALGKAEAKDMYEDLKKKFNLKVHELKQKTEHTREVIDEDALKLRNAFEELQVQLALGKAETKELFETQRKSITEALGKMETIIKNNPTTNRYYHIVLDEIEKFRIKLEILRLRFELKKMDVSAELEGQKKEFQMAMEKLKDKLLKKENKAGTKYEHFRDEISEAYGHVKKAFNL